MTTPHEVVDPPGLMKAVGYSHAIAAAQGRTVWVAGQIAADTEGAIVSGDWGEQFDVALGNVVTCLRAANAEPHHVVSMQLFTSDIAGYRATVAERIRDHRCVTLAGHICLFCGHVGDTGPNAQRISFEDRFAKNHL